MRLVNMQDGIIKSSLVQQLQERSSELAKTQQATHVPFNEEMARKAEEVVEETSQLENGTIREDEEGEGRRGQKRRKKRRRAMLQQNEEESDQDNEEPDEGIHRIDITI